MSRSQGIVWTRRVVINAILLGSNFWSLIGGAALSLAGSILVDTLQGDSLPVLPAYAFGAAVSLTISGFAWVLLAVRLSQLNGEYAHTPGQTERDALDFYMSVQSNIEAALRNRLVIGLLGVLGAAASFVVRQAVI